MAKWALIIGERREGRDDTVLELVTQWTAAGLQVSGCTQVALPGPDGPVGYDAQCLWGATLAVARPSPEPTLCGFAFVEETFETIRRELQRRQPDITVLPGAKLESAEQGHWPAMNDALNADEGLLVLVLRPHIVGRIAVRLPDPVAYLELPNSVDEVRNFSEAVLAAQASRGEKVSARAADSDG